MEKTRLQADVVTPAEAARLAAEAEAKASAAPVLEMGRAQAAVLQMLYAEIQRGGEAGLQVFLAEKLPELLGVAVEAMKDVQIDRLTVIDGGGGSGVANAATQRVNGAYLALEQVAGSMGLDLQQLAQRITRVAATGPNGPEPAGRKVESAG